MQSKIMLDSSHQTIPYLLIYMMTSFRLSLNVNFVYCFYEQGSNYLISKMIIFFVYLFDIASEIAWQINIPTIEPPSYLPIVASPKYEGLPNFARRFLAISTPFFASI